MEWAVGVALFAMFVAGRKSVKNQVKDVINHTDKVVDLNLDSQGVLHIEAVSEVE